MEYSEIYSAVVIVGEGFSPPIFIASQYQDILGPPDLTNAVITPVISQQEFPQTGFRVVVTPDRIELGFNGQEILPDSLLTLAKKINEVLEQVNINCTGLGINLNVVMNLEELGITGIQYCREKFVSIGNIEDVLQSDNILANTAKFIYDKGAVRYVVDIEPHQATNGRLLYIKMNAHQNINTDNTVVNSLDNFSLTKEYLENLPTKIVGG